MKAKEIFTKALTSNYLIIDKPDLTPLLERSEIIRTEDTILSDLIRLLKYDNKYFIQETTDKKEIMIRKIISIADADRFIRERLDFYERKWDGCGCKIDYYE